MSSAAKRARAILLLDLPCNRPIKCHQVLVRCTRITKQFHTAGKPKSHDVAHIWIGREATSQFKPIRILIARKAQNSVNASVVNKAIAVVLHSENPSVLCGAKMSTHPSRCCFLQSLLKDGGVFSL